MKYCYPFVLILFAVSSLQAAIVEYNLLLEEKTLDVTGEPVRAMMINGNIPAPQLHFTEGDTAVIRVTSHLSEDSSLHWHGLLVPNDQDGVPHVNTPPIKPGQTVTYTFPIRQQGTYWYHSHSVLQEQLGLYGAFIIQPKEKIVQVDRDIAVVVSDWTNQHPNDVLLDLRRNNEFQQRKKNNFPSVIEAFNKGGLGTLFSQSMHNMPLMDLSDIAYDHFLVNGKHDLSIDAKPGEIVRLRLINAATSTYFYIEYASGPLQVLSADGMDVEPVYLDRFLVSPAETYDFLITVPHHGSHEIRLTAQDVSGHTSIFIGQGEQQFAPDIPKPNLYAGHMSHGNMETAMNTDASGYETHQTTASAHSEHTQHPSPENKTTEKAHPGHAIHEHNDMDMPKKNSATAGPVNPRGDNEYPLAPYKHLRSIKNTVIHHEKPLREYDLILDGDMVRYVWTINGKTLDETDPIIIRSGERVRFHFENKSMMHHPMHLHGHFFRVINKHGDYSPLKHTLDIPPMSKATIEFEANEPGDWILHCHILYHMEVGMMLVIRYQDNPPSPHYHKPSVLKPMHNPKFFWGQASILTNMTNGFITLQNNRNTLNAIWEVGWQDTDQNRYKLLTDYERFITSQFSLFAGGRFDNERNAGVFGSNLLLPFFFELSTWINTDANIHVSLRKEIHLTKQLSIFGSGSYDTDTKWESSVGTAWYLDKHTSLILKWHSDYGFGVGARVNF